MKKSLFTILCCLLCSFVLFSCNSFFGRSDGETALSVLLPYGSGKGRAASGESYSFSLNFVHESGAEFEATGSSGEKIVLSPAEPGDYTIYGKAFNSKNEIVYEGETTAVAEKGSDTKVTLVLDRQLFEPEAITKHMTLTPDKKGVKVTLYALEGEITWEEYNCYVTEESTGLRMEVPSAPTAGNPVVLYYPFTKKGQKYDFTLHVRMVGKPDEYVKDELASCTAAGGDDTYFTSFTGDYAKTKLILDSENYSVKLSRDMLSVINQDKVDGGQILNMGVYINLLAGNNNWTNTLWGCYELCTKYTQTGMPLTYNKLLEGGYSLADNSSDALETFAKRYTWWGGYGLRFAIKDLPDQNFKGPDLQSELFDYTKAVESLNSEHVTVTPSSKGIMVEVKRPAGEAEWYDYSRIECEDGSYMIKFEDNTIPDAGNSESFDVTLTEAGKYTGFNVRIYLKNGKSIEEYVFCKAGGGNKSMLNIPENWGEVSLDCNNYVLKYDGYGLDTLINDATSLSAFKIRYFLFAGNNEVNTFVTSKDIVLFDITDLSNIVANNISQLPTAISGIHITDEAVAGPSAKYILGNYKEWWANFAISFMVQDTSTYITLREIGAVKPFTGQAYEDKYVQSNNVPITDSDWTLYYSCFEKDLPNITVIDSGVDASGHSYIEFSIDKNFNNDDFEYQVVLNNTLSGLSGKKLKIEFTVTCDQDSELEINSNDGTKNISYVQFKDASKIEAGTPKTYEMTEDNMHNTSSSDTFNIMVIPYTAGKYKFTVNNLTKFEP